MPRNPLPALLLVALAAPLSAQSTGTPVFHEPYRGFDRTELGGNVSDVGNITLEAFYGFSQAGARLVSGASRLFIPFGLSVGRRVSFTHSTVSLLPYAEPVLVPNFGDGGSDGAVALGGDLRINRRFELRAAIGIGDIKNF